MKPVDSPAELLRLGDQSGSELASALRALSQRGPDATELASLATRLALQGVAMAPAAGAAPAPSALHGGRWKLALLGTAALSGLGFWLFSRAPTPAAAPSLAPSSVGLVSAVQPSNASGQRVTVEPLGRPASPGPRSPAPSASAASSASTSTSTSTSPSAVEVSEATQALQAGAPTPAGVIEPLPRAAALVKGKSSVAQGALENGAEVSAPDAAQPTELELLRGARLALKGSPAEALRLVEQHRASYPSGKLTQERELIAISALVALGRRTAALSRASSFEHAFPTSPYRKQIGELLQ